MQISLKIHERIHCETKLKSNDSHENLKRFENANETVEAKSVDKHMETENENENTNETFEAENLYKPMENAR